MVGIGMIFAETYRPFFENTRRDGFYDRRFGLFEVDLTAVASRTGHRAEVYKRASRGKVADFQSFAGSDAVAQLVDTDLDFVCVPGLDLSMEQSVTILSRDNAQHGHPQTLR